LRTFKGKHFSEAIMKKLVLSALAISSAWTFAATAVHAAQNDDVVARIEALERENAAIKKENTALRENQALRKQNASLKTSSQAPADMTQGRAAPSALRTDPLAAYAADVPMAYKAQAPVERGQLRVWADGGATWTGGDANPNFFSALNFSSISETGSIFGSSPTSFDMRPNLGWEAAAGFDYRFAGSPWHVSGQIRYGEGNANGSFNTSGGINPNTLGLSTPITFFGGSQSVNANGTEAHWLADLAVGRDVLGSGPDAMQLKVGVRVSQFTATVNSIEVDNLTEISSVPLIISGIPVSSFSETTTTGLSQQSRFLGAGPRIGVEGAVPLAGAWTFDYTGDAAALFGTQTFSQTSTSSFVVSPAILGFLGGGSSAASSSADQRFNTVFNADLQVGVSYWISPSVKLSASYRVDAYFNVLTGLSAVNDPTKLQTMNRYIQGPHLGVSAVF
jgi:Legionella pneumophila major outer membrane protein precursor